MSVRRFAVGLALAAAGAFAADLIGAPLPYVFGPMLVVAVANFSGAGLVPPPASLSILTRVTIGALIGSSVNPDLLVRLPELGVSAALVPVQIAAGLFCGMAFLRRVTRMSPAERVLGVLPGGFFSIVGALEESGGKARRIALFHTVRVALLVAAVPYAASWGLGVEGDVRPMSSSVLAMPRGELGGFLLIAALGFGVSRLVNFPGGPVLFTILIAAAARFAGAGGFPPPLELAIIAQVLLGMQIGIRFGSDSPARFRAWLGIAFVLAMITFAISLVIAVGLHLTTGLPLATALLAFAPGGIAEIGIIAVALGIDPGFVAAIHLWRLLLIFAVLPLAIRKLPARQDTEWARVPSPPPETRK